LVGFKPQGIKGWTLGWKGWYYWFSNPRRKLGLGTPWVQNLEMVIGAFSFKRFDSGFSPSNGLALNYLYIPGVQTFGPKVGKNTQKVWKQLWSKRFPLGQGPLTHCWH